MLKHHIRISPLVSKGALTLNLKMNIQLVLVLSLVLMSTATQQSLQFYCGRRLADTLAIICESSYEKRSGGASAGLDYDMEWPWMVAQRARLLRAPMKRQVVSECCDKPCSIEELLTYC